MKSQMREADRHHTMFTVIVGDSELESDSATIRNMESGEQNMVGVDSLVSWFKVQLEESSVE